VNANLELDVLSTIDALPSSLINSKWVWSENNRKIRSQGTFPSSQHFGDVLEFWDETRKNDKHLITHMDMHKPNNKLVNDILSYILLN
jgi:hypothetical protein